MRIAAVKNTIPASGRLSSLPCLACIVCMCCYFLFLASPAIAQQSPLIVAVKSNRIEDLKALLEKKINVNVFDEDSDHVLMCAAMYASIDCMELLLKNSADVNATNKAGETPLMWCNHDVQKTKLLLQYGATVNAKAKSGNTALLIACVGNGQYEMIKLLLDNGADPLATNNLNHTALFRAATFGDTATARLLLGKGIDINAITKNKETALETAVLNDNKELLYWLLKNGANPNITDAYEAVPLSYAGVLNDANILKALLEKTTDVNCMDTDGITPLMWACFNEHNNPEIIKVLLAKGAMVNLQDKKGHTALVWALKKGNTETVAILRNAGARQ